MKINAKIAALAGAALLMGSVAFAASSYEGATDDYELPQGFTFYNEVSSDVVEAEGSFYNKSQRTGWNGATTGADANRNYQVEFAGISEKVGISYDSEKFWFELAPKFSLKDNNQHWKINGQAWTNTRQSLNNDDLSFAWTGLDWGVRFTPFDIVDFYLHKDVYTPGSKLPIADKNVGGNLAGDGFSVVFKPIDGLRIGLAVPFSADIISKPNFLNAEYEDTGNNGSFLPATSSLITNTENTAADYRFVFNAGVDYKLLDMITVGAFVGNIINRDARSYGLYANAGISFLDFNVGYTYNGEATKVSPVDFNDTKIVIGGHHKANLAVSAQFGDFTAQLEALMNFFKAQSLYDLYAGIKVGYDLLPGKFNLALRTGVAYDMGNKSATGCGSYLRYEEGATAGEVTSAVTGYRSKKGSYKDWNKDPAGVKGVNANAAPVVFLAPSIKYTTGRNTFTATANLQYWLDGEGSYAANLPVSWKYAF